MTFFSIYKKFEKKLFNAIWSTLLDTLHRLYTFQKFNLIKRKIFTQNKKTKNPISNPLSLPVSKQSGSRVPRVLSAAKPVSSSPVLRLPIPAPIPVLLHPLRRHPTLSRGDRNSSWAEGPASRSAPPVASRGHRLSAGWETGESGIRTPGARDRPSRGSSRTPCCVVSVRAPRPPTGRRRAPRRTESPCTPRWPARKRCRGPSGPPVRLLLLLHHHRIPSRRSSCGT